jgi:translation initiation factor IF-2
MAKVRVHELAKELQMENKALVDMIRELGIEVKTSSSTLSDEEASLIKGHLEGTKSLVVEEQRIKSTVIRRRKKIVEVTPEPGQVLEPAPAPPVGAVPEPSLPEITPEPPIPTPSEPPLVPSTLPAETVHPKAAPPEPAAVVAPEMVPETVPTEPTRPEVAVETVPPAPAEPPAPKLVKPPRPAKMTPAKVIRQAPAPAPAPAPPPSAPSVPPILQPKAAPTALKAAEEKKAEAEKKEKGAPKKPVKSGRGAAEPEPARGKVFKKRKEVLEREELYEVGARDGRVFKAMKAGKLTAKKFKKTEITTPKAIKRRIKIAETIPVGELAKRMGVKGSDLIRRLIALGLMVNLNQSVDFDVAALVAGEFGYEIDKISFEEEELLKLHIDQPEELTPRPPVVTIMGHVDHGKTSLLDLIRKTNITQGEAGGITQHIGAYHVQLDRGEIVFLDTPGHEAFTAMRARGAQVTDIVVLVVAADDGVMQQTKEAIDHSRAAGVPIIVAVNKIDKPGANPERIRRQLAENGLAPEEWGGDTIFAEVSAKTGQGVDNLLEMILLQAEVLELKANPKKPAVGRVVEARLDKGRGPMATVLIQGGTLKPGDPFVCGVQFGKVRALYNDFGQKVDQAPPSTPVEVHGFSGVPMAGEEFLVLEDERTAKQVSAHRLQKKREAELSKTSKITLEKLYEQIQEGQVKELNIILKADVQGSVEAITEALHKLSTPEVKVNIIHVSTGAVTETDIMLGSASKAIIIGFNVRPNSKAQELAEQEQVEIRFYDIIYQLVSEVKDAMAGMLEPIQKEVVNGHAEVRQLFHIPKVGTVAGCGVLDGKIDRSAKARLLRDSVVIFDGRLSSLKRFKDDAREVVAGYECGLSLDGYNDIKLGDIIESYYVEEIQATL